MHAYLSTLKRVKMFYFIKLYVKYEILPSETVRTQLELKLNHIFFHTLFYLFQPCGTVNVEVIC